MSDPTEEILSRTRRAWEPTEADAERVLRATHATLGAPRSPPSAAGGSAAPASSVVAAALKWTLGALMVATAALGGYAIGLRDGREQSRASEVPAGETQPRSPLPPPDTRVTAPHAEGFSTQPPQAAARGDQGLSQPAEAAAPRDPGSSRQPQAATPRDPGSSQPQAAPPPPSSAALTHAAIDPSPAPAAMRPAPARVPSLQDELRALQRVERALRDGQPELALRVLSQLDRELPNGQMLEERAAGRALARCAGTKSTAVARDFAHHHPGSVYAARIRASCEEEALQP